MSNKPYYEGTRQYIGARYVPKFADPVEWNDQMAYEPMTIVTYMNSSYTSRKQVPAGTLPTNNEYWALTGNYNAAIGDIQSEVDRLSGEIDGFQASIDGFQASIDAVETKVDAGLKAANDAIAINTTAISTINTDLSGLESTVNAITPKVNDLFKMFNNKRIAIFGDSISDPNIEWNDAVKITWAVRFAAEMQKYGATVTNYAKSSAAFVPATDQNPNLVQQITTIPTNTYDIGIILGGVNDFFGNITLGNPYSVGDSIVSFWSSLFHVANHINSSGATDIPKIFVVTPLDTGWANTNYRGYTLDYFRIALASWAHSNGFGLINGCDIPGWNPAKHTADGLHPSNEYTGIISDYIISKLLANGDANAVLKGYYLSQQGTGANASNYSNKTASCSVDPYGNVTLQLSINALSTTPGKLNFVGICPYFGLGMQSIPFIDGNHVQGYATLIPNNNNNTFTVELVYPSGAQVGGSNSIIFSGWSNALAYNTLIDVGAHPTT